jgi:hypothetical protein
MDESIVLQYAPDNRLALTLSCHPMSAGRKYQFALEEFMGKVFPWNKLNQEWSQLIGHLI